VPLVVGARPGCAPRRYRHLIEQWTEFWVAVAGAADVVVAAAMDVAAVATPESTALETTPLETTPLDPALLPHPAVTNRSAAPMTPTAPARRLGTARLRLDRPTGSM
jgi:hypothetical protein